MKNVLLVAPFTKSDLCRHRWVTPSLGLFRIASWLEKYGHSCKVYDCNEPGNIDFETTLKEKSWDIVGFSDLESCMENTIPNMFLAKEVCPNSRIVAGGSGPALRYQYYLDNTPAEIIILSEGEYPLLDLCNEVPISDIKGIVFKNKAKILTSEDYWEISKDINFEKMPFEKYWNHTASFYKEPDFNEIYTVRLFTSNFCPMQCSFCTLTNWKKIASGRMCPVVALSPEQIVNLIFRILETHPKTRQIFFVDDDFFILKQRGIDFCNKIIELRSQNKLPEYLKFICLTNINRIHEDNINLIKRAGFRVLSIGVESTSQHVLKSLNKKQTVEHIWNATELILKEGIKPYYTVILFTPFATKDDLLIDLEGFRKLISMGVGLSLEPYLIPLPGTPLWEDYQPMSMRTVGEKIKIKKGFSWPPVEEETRKIFDKFEEIYPKYRKWRFDTDGVGHKEKSYQALVILDCLEYVLRFYFSIEVKTSTLKNLETIEENLKKYSHIKAVDIVGDFEEE